MRVMTSLKKTIFLAMVVILLGFFVACSNSAGEPNEINENENEVDSSNHLVDNEGPFGDIISESPPDVSDADTNGDVNENSSVDDEERANEAEAELDEGSDSDNTNEEPQKVGNDNINNDQGAENAGQTTPSETDTRVERPTLRSPVDSADDPRTLTIGVLHFEHKRQHESFREHYTRMFEWDHPQVDIEFVVATEVENHFFRPPRIDTVAELRKMITGDNPPDVLFLGYNDYRALMEEGLLVALNPFLVESDLSLDDFEPIVADGLVNPQDGQTYGLSPFFIAQAIIYNKDLFDEKNVPYPRDRMTWEEVFTLAKQMTFHDGEKNIYGFMFDLYNYRPPSMFELWRRYIPGLGVKVYDLETEKMVVNNDKWAYVFNSIKDLYDAGVFPLDQSEGEKYPGRNKFLSGTIAMGLIDYATLRLFIDQTPQGSMPNWDIVSMPVHPEAPHVGAGVVMEPVIAISATGRNQLDAWRLMESIHSPEWAKGYGYQLSSRKDYAVNLLEIEYNKEAFYQLRPAELYEPNVPQFGFHTIHNQYMGGGTYGLHKVLTGEWTVEEALEEWEHEGNTAIFVENPEQFDRQ